MSEELNATKIKALEKLIGDVIHGMEKQNKRTQQLGELQNKINQTNIDIQKESGAEIIELGNTIDEHSDISHDLRTDHEELAKLHIELIDTFDAHLADDDKSIMDAVTGNAMSIQDLEGELKGARTRITELELRLNRQEAKQ